MYQVYFAVTMAKNIYAISIYIQALILHFLNQNSIL